MVPQNTTDSSPHRAARIGAAFGCAMGPVLGLPAGFAAALGLASVFCGATNCPLAAIALAIELFGSGGLLYFALAPR